MANRLTGKRVALLALAGAVVLAGGAYGVFAWVSGGGEPPVSLASMDAAGTAGSDTSGTTSFDGDLDGTWTVVPDDSFVGYRVREQLAFLPAPNDAVGRTTAVEGSIEISGLEVVSASVSADLTQLQSDESRRDDTIRHSGLESDTYPDATFELAEPIAFATLPEEGEVVDAQAVGNLTLHGVTRQVTLPLQARWNDGRIDVVGSLDIAFADYDITPPSIGPATVEDHGTIEVQLVFVPGA